MKNTQRKPAALTFSDGEGSATKKDEMVKVKSPVIKAKGFLDPDSQEEDKNDG